MGNKSRRPSANKQGANKHTKANTPNGKRSGTESRRKKTAPQGDAAEPRKRTRTAGRDNAVAEPRRNRTASQGSMAEPRRNRTAPQGNAAEPRKRTAGRDNAVAEPRKRTKTAGRGLSGRELSVRGEILSGTFYRRSNGKHTFVPDGAKEGEAAIGIDEGYAHHALDGDKVRVQLLLRWNDAPEGEVMEITEEGKHTFVGQLQVRRHTAFLVNEERTLGMDIFIPEDRLKGGQTGDKAIVRITSWPEEYDNPFGEVVDILGRAGENTAEMHAILAEFGLPYSYPAELEEAADAISEGITPAEVARREDFRNVLTFTIDPKDAKDFDDALSARCLPNGNWEVGVHIADVTHYVKEGSAIDREAQQRATSVYLVDRTIPMLPERLSNLVCSLRPQEEKLCFAAIFELDAAAHVQSSRIVRTVIRSDRRFTYEEAQEVIETGWGDCREAILALDALAKQLRQERFRHGAINFEGFEVKFDMDETGKPLGVYFKESKDANKLIEEFMLLANRTVAESIARPQGKSPKTFVYRIHEAPDAAKMENFAVFISRFGYKLQIEGKPSEISRGINHLLEQVQGRPEKNMVETLAVRSMQKARYSTANEGHYGLAFKYYTHFTSPIRRYPDMMVHRLLERYLANGSSARRDEYDALCRHSSAMEMVAANAERASIKYKQVEYMQDKVGRVFEGIISGITDWGMYVELNENKCEGLVPIRTLKDDFYEYDSKNYCLIGRRRKHKFQLGDPFTVEVTNANLVRKQLDFKPHLR